MYTMTVDEARYMMLSVNEIEEMDTMDAGNKNYLTPVVKKVVGSKFSDRLRKYWEENKEAICSSFAFLSGSYYMPNR